MIKRNIQENIERWLFRGKVIVIYGARQVGKTTLCKQILKKYAHKRCEYFNCELFSVKSEFETTNEESLKKILGNSELVVLDEAQNIENIGIVLKIIVDTFPHVQVIATGSSSFELANRISEPMTGRVIPFILYPLSVHEITATTGYTKTEAKIEDLMRFGSYPAVFDLPEKDARVLLESIASNYLYKDILMFEKLKNSKQLLELLQLLALQLGSQVSYHELGQKLALSSATVKKYIDLLEKCFVVYTLPAFSRNKRNEIGKSVKIYFYDLGIRNSLVQAFTPLKLRNDVGALWENFCITERIKFNQANENYVNRYFWRTYKGEEVDYIEEHSGRLDGYEFKYNPKAKSKKPTKFLETYENASVKIVHRNNWSEFLL